MPVMTPYKMQIFVSDDLRRELKAAAHRNETTLQDLVVTWLHERLRQDEHRDDRQRQAVAR